MNSQDQPNLQQQFEAATKQVDNFPPEQGADRMVELYGLYKQATAGDHDTKGEEVDQDDHDNPNGPAGLSQAQWDSWSKLKGVPEEEAKQRYVDLVSQITGSSPKKEGTPSIPANEAPAAGTAKVDDPQPGNSQGGLRGNLDAGAPYGGEDELKLEQ